MFFFREVVFSGFDLVFGGKVDMRYVVAILEHWYRVFTLDASWLSPGFYYPVEGNLGRGDAFFLYALPYSFFRACGLGIYTAFIVVILLYALMGFWAMARFLHSVLELPFSLSLFGASVFVILNQTTVTASVGQVQLLSGWFLPVFGLLIHACSQGLEGAPRRAAWMGAAAVLLFDALVYTSFYIGWFIALFSLTFALSAVLYLTWLGHLRHAVHSFAGGRGDITDSSSSGRRSGLPA